MSRARTLGLGILLLLVLVLLGSLVAGMRGGGAGEAAGRSEPPEEEARVRVEVLNAAGIPGLARRATERLRDEGFDVVYYGNAPSFHPDTSLVVHRLGDHAAAERVAEAIGIERVRSLPDSSLYLEATVVLGRDWVEATAEESQVVRE